MLPVLPPRRRVLPMAAAVEGAVFMLVVGLLFALSADDVLGRLAPGAIRVAA